jgi:hypothetical protein
MNVPLSPCHDERIEEAMPRYTTKMRALFARGGGQPIFCLNFSSLDMHANILVMWRAAVTPSMQSWQPSVQPDREFKLVACPSGDITSSILAQAVMAK